MNFPNKETSVGKSEFSSGKASSTNGMKEVTNLIVSMSDNMINRCAALHNKYRGIEWSGPAWFKCDETRLVWELVDFFVLDVGTSTFTEWEQRDIAAAKVYDTIYFRNGENPEFFEKHICGNIHTHHTMAHFFSGTDSAAVFEHTPDGEMWPSIIVNNGLRSCAFGVGYKDMFGFTNLLFNNDVPFERAQDNGAELIQDELQYLESKKKSFRSGPSRGTQMDLYRGRRDLISSPVVTTPLENGGQAIWTEIYNDVKEEIENCVSERQFNRLVNKMKRDNNWEILKATIKFHGGIRTKFGVVTMSDIQ